MLVNVNETQVGLETRENVKVTTISVRKDRGGTDIMMHYLLGTQNQMPVSLGCCWEHHKQVQGEPTEQRQVLSGGKLRTGFRKYSMGMCAECGSVCD